MASRDEKERQGIERRLDRLDRIEPMLGDAGEHLQTAGRLPEEVRIRSRFVRRTTPASSDASDRKLPPRPERPPAMRLLSPRGIALRLYMIALCEAQSRARSGETASNDRRLVAGGEETGWIDLVAAPVQAEGRGATLISRADKKRRMLTSALDALSHQEVQLVHLPKGDHPKAREKYEKFRLLDEGGARGGEVPYYVRPPKEERNVFSLPSTLFTNGWIHLLENTELAFLMMIANEMRSQGQFVKISGNSRILYYGFGRDAYKAHLTLARFGLIHVVIAENRFWDMKVKDYGEGGEAMLHAFSMIRSGFDQAALPVIRKALKTELAT